MLGAEEPLGVLQNLVVVGGELRVGREDVRGVDVPLVEGHEPGPIGRYFPTLAHEGGVATDISHFRRVGGSVVFVCRRDRGVGAGGWKDSLLWCPAGA